MASKLIWKRLASQIMAETITEERIWCALRFHELDAFRYRANRAIPGERWPSTVHHHLAGMQRLFEQRVYAGVEEKKNYIQQI